MKAKSKKQKIEGHATCNFCGNIFPTNRPNKDKYCCNRCRKLWYREYHRTYKRKERSEPYLKFTKVPTNRRCTFCGGIIFRVIDHEGIMVFNRMYYCHERACQAAWKNRSSMMDEFLEVSYNEGEQL